MKNYAQSMTVVGTVIDVRPEHASFVLRCRSGDEFEIFVGPTTSFQVVRNLDGIDRDRVRAPERVDGDGDLQYNIRKYVRQGGLIGVQGIYQEHEPNTRFDARSIHLLHSTTGNYLFEDTHWWLTQIARLADEWLEDVFGSTRTYGVDDFARLYRTNLNIMGGETDDNVQECATLSRLIYGLSSAYLLTGTERYYLAAKAGVDYMRQSFRNLSHDGRYCFWAFGRRKLKNGEIVIVASENDDDRDSIPLYEQIYVLAGLAQFYRITLDWEVLEDIRRTVNMFNDFYLDEISKNPEFPGHGGYFSHLDYATMRPDVPELGKNQSRKNWNSIGDHIPAYLVNLLLSLDPLPQGGNAFAVQVDSFAGFGDAIVEKILRELTDLPGMFD